MFRPPFPFTKNPPPDTRKRAQPAADFFCAGNPLRKGRVQETPPIGGTKSPRACDYAFSPRAVPPTTVVEAVMASRIFSATSGCSMR